MQELGSKCVRCGFSDFRALQIDHVNGGGRSEARRLAGVAYYLHVLDHINDGTYQLLCANCNWIKRAENEEVGGRSYVEKVAQIDLAESLRLLTAKRQSREDALNDKRSIHKSMLELHNEGYSYKDIASKLREEGHPMSWEKVRYHLQNECVCMREAARPNNHIGHSLAIPPSSSAGREA
ncbi:MAG: hypothetical protein JRN73_09990 [Nitrososphaerota archaeon]|nr:hypothetical protein [Nitrososphaerota archaeon]MDG7018667.1 hypothetical protein [Nitrososphaerota archaeon]MDG7019993.1 hypothetical protein [Nitrososphaerota archaeon]